MEVSELLPVVFFEGAVSVATDTNLSPAPTTTSRLTIRFNQGENYAALVRRYSSAFSAVSDLAASYIHRRGEVIPVDLKPMLYDATYYSDLTVEQHDVLVVPFKQFFVTVSGAVNMPGRYPYIPDRDWSYYIGLAGGFNILQNSYEKIDIKDAQGKRLTKSDIITPESIIDAKANSFIFHFNQYAPVVTTILTVISTTLTIISFTK